MLTVEQSHSLKTVLDNGFVIPGWLHPRFDNTRMLKRLKVEELQDSLAAILTASESVQAQEAKTRTRRLKEGELGTSTLVLLEGINTPTVNDIDSYGPIYGPQALIDISVRTQTNPYATQFSFYVTGEKPTTEADLLAGALLFSKTPDVVFSPYGLYAGNAGEVVHFSNLLEIIDVDSFYISVLATGLSASDNRWGATCLFREIGGVPIRDRLEDGYYDRVNSRNRGNRREHEEEIEKKLEDKGCGPGVEPIAPGRWLGSIYLAPTCGIAVR